MKTIGYLLITGGVLAGSYFSVLDTFEVPWKWALPCLIVGLIGVALVRWSTHGESRASDRVEANVGNVRDSARRLRDNSARLDDEKDSINTYEVRNKIDELFMEDLNTFVEARESIGHRWGLQAYADVMTPFATGERYLNRAWSASADGYIDEVNNYLGKAREQFAEVVELLEGLEATTPTTPPA